MLTAFVPRNVKGLKFAPKKPPKKPAKVVPKTYVLQFKFSFIIGQGLLDR